MNYEIQIEGRRGSWRADLISPPRPGSPLIGTGQTREMALACLMFHLLADKRNFRSVIGGTLKINGKLWKDGKGSRR